jgi:hypothetical protein
MDEQGPKQPRFRGPDRQPAASTPQAEGGRTPPRPHASIAEVLVEHLGALRKDTAAPDRSLTRAWRQRASTRPGLRRNGRGPLHQWTVSHAMLPPEIVEHRRAVRWAAMSAQHKGTTSSDLHGPPAAIQAQQETTPEYVQWAHSHRSHIATLVQTHTHSDVLARTWDDTTRTTLTCWYGTKPPARSWVEPSPPLVAALRGAYTGSVMAGHDPSNPPPPAGGATGHRRGRQPSGSSRARARRPMPPHGWSTEHASHRAAPRPPGTHGTTSPSRTHHILSRVTGLNRSASGQQPLADADLWARGRETPSTTQELAALTRPSASPSTHRNHQRDVKYMQGRAPPALTACPRE